MTGLGARIAAARTHARLSQATLGKRLGVSQVAVSHWETGRREPCLADLIALGRELGVTLAHLAGAEPSEPEAYWAGWRAGWLACAENARAAVALDPTRFPPLDGRDAAGIPESDGEPQWMRALHEHQVRGGDR